MSKARELAELSRTVSDSADATAITINSDEEVTFASGVTVTGALSATGTSVFASLDISGDIDVAGVTNLDVVDIDGAVDMASTLGVTGVATLASLVATTADINGGTIDGTVIGGTTAAAGSFTTGSFSETTFVGLTARPAGVPATAGRLWAAQNETGNYGIVSKASTTDSFTYIGNTGTKATLGQSYGSTGSYLPLVLQTSDIDRLTISAAGAATFSGAVTANAGIVVDTMTLDAATLTATGDFTVDAVGDIILDADTGVWRFKDAGTTLYQIAIDGASVVLYTGVSDAAMVFKGNDGGSTVTALTLDMSAAGAATFNAGVTATNLKTTDYIIIQADDAQLYFTNAANNRYNLLERDASNNFYLKRFDGSSVVTDLTFNSAGAATFNSSVTATSLDISGDIDVDGTANLDVVDIDGALTGTTATFVGANTLTLRNDTATDADEPKLTFDNDTFAGANYGNIRTGNGGLQLILESPSTSTFQNRQRILFNSGGSDELSFDLSTDNGSSFTNYFKLDGGNAIFNETGADKDFRVESSGNANMLFVDGGQNRVSIGGSNPQGTLHVDKDIASGANYGIIQNDGTANTNTIAGWVIRDGSSIMSGIRRRRDGASSPTEIGNFSNDEAVFFLQNNESCLQLNGDGSIVFNEDSLDKDFRVESDTNTHALFVDAGNNHIILGGSAIDQSGTFGYRLASDDIRHARPSATAGDTIICAVYGVSNGLQITDDTSNNRVYKFHNAGAQSFSLGMTEAAFNEDGIDRDFRVESDTMTHALYVDGASGKVGVFQAAPRSTLEVGSPNAKHGIQLNGGPNGVATQIHMIDGKSGSYTTLTIDIQLGGAGGYMYQVQVAGTSGCNFQTGGGYTNGTGNFSHSLATGSGFTVTSPSNNLIRLVAQSGVGTHPVCEIRMTQALNGDHDQDNVTITWSS
jgi:hypothetical protein